MPALIDATWNSLIVGVAAAILATILGICAARAVTRYHSFGTLRRPRLRCREILMKSSRKPTTPRPVIRNSTSSADTVTSDMVNRWASAYAARLAR